MRLQYILKRTLVLTLLTGAFQNLAFANKSCFEVINQKSVGPRFQPLLAKIQNGAIKNVHQLLTEVEGGLVAGTIKKESNQILSKSDSADLLNLILETAPQPSKGYESNVLKGYEGRLVEIGIDHRAVDSNFLARAAQNPKLAQGADLVSFLSSIEFAVDRATYRSQVDGAVVRKWVTGLINPVRREFAERVTTSGFALPAPIDRLSTHTELMSGWYSNLGGAYKVIISRSPSLSVADLNVLKAVINLVDFKKFSEAYKKEIMSKPIGISQLADLFGIQPDSISAYINSQKRTSEIVDFTVNTGGNDMKSEILRAAVKDMIKNGEVALSPSVIDGI